MVNLHTQDEATRRLNVASIRRGESIPTPEGPAQQREGSCLSLPTHVLMATGGDIRLRTDPETMLNGYGCSHRPRPWAITFASSTASSVSERGYLAADAARLRASRIALAERDERAAIRACLGEVRKELARLLQLNAGTEILLAASGTDSELLALALCHPGGDQQAPICNILIGPEETGRGVPLAARGLHFAVDTALGVKVAPGTLIDGFREDTRLCSIAIRDESGLARPIEAIEHDIRATVKEALSRGDRVLLHALDLSKTGLLAPRPSLLIELRRTYGDRIDIVVDACQTRLSPSSIRRYLEMDAVVQITGSKFFTGPPFSGAALVPKGMSRRIKDGKMPAGLIDYFGQDDFIAASSAGRKLHHTGNIGLALRWHAALCEMRAFFEIPALDRISILRQFGEMVQSILATDRAFARVSQPDPIRFSDKKSWETIPTIFPFFVVINTHRKASWDLRNFRQYIDG